MSDAPPRKPAKATLLILGGSAEAATLAQAAVERFGKTMRIVTSLAGRTATPKKLPGEMRVGGFGGVEGLKAYLAAENVRLVIDALHPYATTMARHAVEACEAASVPRLALRRAPWVRQESDNWLGVPDAAAAARALTERGVKRVFLASGMTDIAAFANLPDIWFLVRLVEPQGETLPLERHGLIFARGPFDAGQDEILLKRHGIEAVVSKNSGGKASVAKIVAARALKIPVVMIAPPAPPPGETVAAVPAAVAWITRQLKS
jgi:precorrin-6A/cobalt-precorrin-6A reductase